MIDRIKVSRNSEKNPTLDYIVRRLSASRPDDRHLIGRLHQGEDFKNAFFSLVDRLTDERRQFTFTELRERDREVHKTNRIDLPGEEARRRQVLRREDIGIPNAFELFFITLLSY